MKIIGNPVGTPLPKPNLMQQNPKKGDYVHGKEEFLSGVGGGSAEIPTFNLVEMGLPTVGVDGSMQYITGDYTEILAALDKGLVKFVIDIEMVGTVSFPVVGVMSDDVYACTHATNAFGEGYYVTIFVRANNVVVQATPLVKYINDYMEEALGGDY